LAERSPPTWTSATLTGPQSSCGGQAIATVNDLQSQRSPSDAPARASTTDAEARVMRMGDGGFRAGRTRRREGHLCDPLNAIASNILQHASHIFG
jgi:hypothetical protein